MQKNTSRRFDLIAFDWDGTLFDSTGIIVRCIQAAVKAVGGTVPSDERAAYVIGLGWQESLAYAAPDVPAEKYPELGAAYRKEWALHVDDLSLFAGTFEMLQDLRARGYKLAVATGKSRRGLDDLLQRKIEGKKLKDLFHASRTADETASKPDPLMLHELMDELGARPEKTLMIGDTTHDLQLAKNAGAASVAVSFGAHLPDAFAQYPVLFVAANMQKLHAWLIEHG